MSLGRQDRTRTTTTYAAEPRSAICLQGHGHECLGTPQWGEAGDDPSQMVAGRLEPGSQAV